jgi:hypothetical protein
MFRILIVSLLAATASVAPAMAQSNPCDAAFKRTDWQRALTACLAQAQQGDVRAEYRLA